NPRTRWLRSPRNAFAVALLTGLAAPVHAAAPFDTAILTNEQIPGQPAGTEFGWMGDFLGWTVLNDAGQLAWLASLTGAAVTSGNDRAIVAGAIGSLGAPAREGDVAPGTAPLPGGPGTYWDNILAPVIASTGSIVYHAGLVSVGASGGIFAGIAPDLSVADGNPAAGTTASYSFFSRPAISTTGEIAFAAELFGTGITTANDRGLWAGPASAPALVAREGDPAPGVGAGVIFADLLISVPFDRPHINAPGRVPFWGRISGPGVVAGVNDEGLWIGGGPGASLLVRLGDPAPGLPAGVVFSQLSWVPTLNDAGEVAFHGRVSGPGITPANDTGIWSGAPGSLMLVARTGDPVPGAPGDVFGSLDLAPLLNGAGDVAFLGTADPPAGFPSREGIWCGTPGSVTNAMLQGDPAPGAPAGMEFLGGLAGFVLAPTGQVAFYTTAFDPLTFVTASGVWATDPAGVLTPVLLGDETITVRPADDRTVANGFGGITLAEGSAGEDGWQHGFNASGDLAVAVVFTDGTAGVLVMHLGPPGAVSALPGAATESPFRLTAAPNPFRSTTELRFATHSPGTTDLRVFDATGRLVRNLSPASGRAGERAVTWNARNDAGRHVASGVYFVRLSGPEGSEWKRVSLVR
ncbi:MAG TPA: T9SS type A sorting domain-containing protein, partial [bacterium]|nr:T9SS type A sorting domain-containing protein [bacterium]